MNIDPENPVIKLCAEGVMAEMQRDFEAAAVLYGRAWALQGNDYEACIVAHYMARIQANPEDILHWNLEALRHADMVADGSVAPFYPSLYLNAGRAYEELGRAWEARQCYEQGMAKAYILPDTELGKITRDALERALLRTGK